MKTRIDFVLRLALVLTVVGTTLTMAQQSPTGDAVPPHRPQGPCDIYAAAGDPCVAAHSTTRALYATYNGPLYQVLRQSDGKTLDIGVVQAAAVAQFRIPADTRTQPHRISSAPAPIAGSASSMTSLPNTTT